MNFSFLSISEVVPDLEGLLNLHCSKRSELTNNNQKISPNKTILCHINIVNVVPTSGDFSSIFCVSRCGGGGCCSCWLDSVGKFFITTILEKFPFLTVDRVCIIRGSLHVVRLISDNLQQSDNTKNSLGN